MAEEKELRAMDAKQREEAELAKLEAAKGNGESADTIAVRPPNRILYAECLRALQRMITDY